MSEKGIILYVDDDADDRHLLEESFPLREDYDLICFASGADLLKYMEYLEQKNRLPSLIISDIHMPALNGLVLLGLIRESSTYYSIPVVMISDAIHILDITTYDCYERVKFLSKPHSYSDLINCWQEIFSFLLDAVRCAPAYHLKK